MVSPSESPKELPLCAPSLFTRIEGDKNGEFTDFFPFSREIAGLLDAIYYGETGYAPEEIDDAIKDPEIERIYSALKEVPDTLLQDLMKTFCEFMEESDNEQDPEKKYMPDKYAYLLSQHPESTIDQKAQILAQDFKATCASPEHQNTSHILWAATQEVREKINFKFAKEEFLESDGIIKKTIFIMVQAIAAWGFREINRGSGQDYQTHNIGLAINTLCSCFYGQTMHAADMGHDIPEDLHAKGLMLLFLPVLLSIWKAMDLSGEEQRQGKNYLLTLYRKVKNLVDGLTKVRRETRQASSAATFTKIIQSHAEPIKILGDRSHNMDTLQGLSVEAQKKNATETWEVYAPIAIARKWKSPAERLIRRSLEILNSDFLEEALALIEDNQKQYMQHLHQIHKKIQTEQRASEEIISVRYIPKGILDLVDARIMHQKTPDKLVAADISEEKLKIPVEIVLLTQNEDNFSEVKNWITNTFSGKKSPEEVQVLSHGQGIKIYVRNKKYGGDMIFRVNTIESEARSLRGALANSNGIPRGVQLAEKSFLQRVQSGEDPFKVAQEELSRPSIVVYTRDGDALEVPFGASVLDVACEIHSDLMIGCEAARVQQHWEGASYHIHPLNEVSKGSRIEILLACEKPRSTPELSQCKPSWIPFLRTAKGRAHLKKFFKKQMTDIQKKEFGEAYIKAIMSALPDIFSEENPLLQCVRGSLRAEKHYGRRDATDEELIRLIGSGEIDVLRVVSYLQEFQEDGNWKLHIQIPDAPGTGLWIRNELEAADINITGAVEKSGHDPKGEGVSVQNYTLSVPQELSSYEFLKMILRMHEKGYNPELRKDKRKSLH